MERLATLWIGKRLSFLELVCLKSMHNIGQTPILYRYEPIENEPDFVEVRDAREIYPIDEMILDTGKNHLEDPRILSDVFRIKLLKRTPYIWVDTDAYALREHKSINGYFFASRRMGMSNSIPNGVLRLPSDSKALNLLDSFVSSAGSIPPWWSDEIVKQYLDKYPDVSFKTLPLGVTGPEALGYFLKLTGENMQALAFGTLYPIRARDKKSFLISPRKFGPESFPQSYSIHLYASGIRRRLMRSTGIPKKGSFLDHLCEITEVDATKHPIMHHHKNSSYSNISS